MRHENRRSRGSALTEFVITIPIFVAMIYGSMYLSELGSFKLKAQEIARFGAWSMAMRPQSDFAEFKNRDKIKEAQDQATEELWSVYRDLDGAHKRISLREGRSGKFMAGEYEEPTRSDIRSTRVDLVPPELDADWDMPTGAGGIVAAMMGLAGSVGELFRKPFQTIGFNTDGQVTSRARVKVKPPWRSADKKLGEALSEHGKIRGADLRKWKLRDSGKRLRDQGPQGAADVSVTLVTDPWRLHDGASAHPDPGKHHDYHSAVERVNERAYKAIPIIGQIIGPILDLLGFADKLPAGIGVAFGKPPEDPGSHVFSRPYTDTERSRPSYNGQPEEGQTSIFKDTGGSIQAGEGGAVRNFETSPLYIDHDHQGPYVDALKARGPGWLGCRKEQERRCQSW